MGGLSRLTPTGRFAAYARVALILALAVLVLTVVFPVRQVGIGERGVKYNRVSGLLDPAILGSGWHLVVPVVHSVTVYPITPRTYAIARDQSAWLQGVDGSIWVPTSDGQRVNLDVHFTYRVDPNKLHLLYEGFDGRAMSDIEREYLSHVFRQAVISVVTGSGMLDVYAGGRAAIQEELRSSLNDSLLGTGIEVELVLVSEVRLSAEAEAVIIAEARKQATVIDAEATSAANELIARSLTDELVRLRTLEKLSSDLKVIMLPATVGGLLELTNLVEVLESEDGGGSQ